MRLAILGCKDNIKEEPMNNTKKPDIKTDRRTADRSVTEDIKDTKKAIVNDSGSLEEISSLNTEKPLDIEFDQNVNKCNDNRIPEPDPSTLITKLCIKDENTGEENQGIDDDEEKEMAVAEDSEGLISQLVNNPLRDDVLLYALTMVGPYQALSKFKYKVKITPGTARKNKAGKAALDLFLRVEHGDPREKALIRALVGNENACRNIPKGSRVLAPHLYAK
ncbi:hypothetical protein KIN20_030580 [Parelaphostrongylus tenuis]|uniref:NFACT protein C-terminal domain-containing protein n=1 Tax=Parelaphostrongylus tenuis TaxID=148309 RepID=A0AAD5R3Z5_PARTN|nr:hypothetical protein KIN20_030580 [Parelaphostrongylus tenuis]